MVGKSVVWNLLQIRKRVVLHLDLGWIYPSPEIIIRFGYGRKSWAGRGLMQSCIPLFIPWMREAGCIFTVL